MKEVIDANYSDQLKELLAILAEEIDARPGARDMAQLVKQYRETLKELELIGESNNDDEISTILQNRALDGKSKPVRKNST